MTEPRVLAEDAGRKGAADSIWLRISGEALSRNQCCPSALIATDDWVRARTRPVPARASRQIGQLQFHCGTPPPAAVPSRIIRTQGIYRKSGTRKAESRASVLILSSSGGEGWGEEALFPCQGWVTFLAFIHAKSLLPAAFALSFTACSVALRLRW